MDLKWVFKGKRSSDSYPMYRRSLLVYHCFGRLELSNVAQHTNDSGHNISIEIFKLMKSVTSPRASSAHAKTLEESIEPGTFSIQY